jgi:hypothetical protein
MEGKKGITLDDIVKIQVYMISNDGRVFVGTCENEMTKTIVASTTTFIELDSDKVASINIEDYIKK